MDYWKVRQDPFINPGSPFVPTSIHEEAVARLVHTIENHDRLAEIRGGAGLGKSRVLIQALRETRSPLRRAARVVSPVEGVEMVSGLAEALGARVPAPQRRGEAWRTLVEAVRLCRCQRLQVVLAIDGCENLREPADQLDLDRLVHVDPHPGSRLTILRVSRDEDAEETRRPSGLRIRIGPLTRTDLQRYVEAKLAAAGRSEPTFTPRAINRLHACTLGIPLNIDRLATLGMMAAALRGLEIITPEVIDGAALEYCPASSSA